MPPKRAKAKSTTKPAAPAGLKVENVPIDSVRLDPRNAKRHGERDLAVTGGSLEEFGQVEPLVVWQGIVIGGNGRLEAMRSRGWTTVDIHRVDHLTEPQARKLAIVLNRSSQLSGWNEDVLKAQLAELADLDVDVSGIGFTDAEIDAIVNAATASTPPAEPESTSEPPAEDPLPAVPSKPKTRKGDVWILGSHRLICGDSTNADDVARLTAGQVINLAFTSPPYASQRKYDESSGFTPIHPDKFVDWFEPISANVKKHLAPDGSFFVNIKPCAEGLDTDLYVFDLVIAHVRDWGWHFATEFCWERNGVPKQVSRRFKNQFEPIFQFTIGDWKMRPDAVRHPSNDVPLSLGKGSGATTWATNQGAGGVIPSNRRPRSADKKSTKSLREMQGTGADVGETIGSGLAFPGNRLPTFTGSHEALGHAAAFPVGLPSFFIQAYTDAGDNVLEPFCGSGSTLIAAENLKRNCFGLEISPAYCDVIVKRWENLTGKKAELERKRAA